MLKNNYITKILALIMLVTLTCSCSTIKLKGNRQKKGEHKSIAEVICNKITGIDSKHQTINKEETLIAGEFYKANSNKTLTLNLAKDGYTRIHFKDEIITDIFFYPEDALQVSIHNSGYLVVMPLLAKSSNASSLPVQLTITTRSKVTQDLLLKFTNKKPQPITIITGEKDVK